MIIDQHGNPVTAQENFHTRNVRQFREVFGASQDPALWSRLIEEELNEFDQALRELLKEYVDVIYVLEGARQVFEEFPDNGVPVGQFERVERAAAAVQAIFPPLVLQMAAQAVHNSNMSKLGDDGKPVRREDGKVLKGPNYKPVDFTAFVGTSVGL